MANCINPIETILRRMMNEADVGLAFPDLLQDIMIIRSIKVTWFRVDII